MAGALQESKPDVPEQRPEGQAAGQQHGGPAGERGGGAAEARARPNVQAQGHGAALSRSVPWSAMLGLQIIEMKLYPSHNFLA